jgi:membrane protease YdiL (CAAX protease family)
VMHPVSRCRRALGLLTLFATSVVFSSLVFGLAYELYEPRLDTRVTRADLLWEFVVVTCALASLVPAAMFSARFVERRPAGTLSSVASSMRWRWLATAFAGCSLVAIVGCLVSLVLEAPAGRFDRMDWRLVAGVAAAALVTVPAQAAGEEYLFRGYLTQFAGAFVRDPRLPAVAISLLFALAHGTEQDVWSFVDRFVFGLVASWLTIRTGGLEAAIALHAVGNIASFTLLTIDGQLHAFVIGPEPALGASAALLDLALVVAVAVALERVAQRSSACSSRAGPGSR